MIVAAIHDYEAAYSRLPLHFERNEGQAANSVRYLARGSGYGHRGPILPDTLALSAGSLDSGL